MNYVLAMVILSTFLLTSITFAQSNISVEERFESALDKEYIGDDWSILNDKENIHSDTQNTNFKPVFLKYKDKFENSNKLKELIKSAIFKGQDSNALFILENSVSKISKSDLIDLIISQIKTFNTVTLNSEEKGKLLTPFLATLIKNEPNYLKTHEDDYNLIINSIRALESGQTPAMLQLIDFDLKYGTNFLLNKSCKTNELALLAEWEDSFLVIDRLLAEGADLSCLRESLSYESSIEIYIDIFESPSEEVAKEAEKQCMVDTLRPLEFLYMKFISMDRFMSFDNETKKCVRRAVYEILHRDGLKNESVNGEEIRVKPNDGLFERKAVSDSPSVNSY